MWRAGTAAGPTRACGDGVRWPALPPVSRAGRTSRSVTGVATTDALLADVREAVSLGATVLALHESATEPLTKLSLAQNDSLMLVIGPEGGIADDEIAALSAAGAKAVRLGPTVLRTSTAAAVALGALGALTSRWG